MGGTGSYILDYISKTPIQQIDLFDGDNFLQHNAFRAPGAATEQELDKCKYKVEYFRDLYNNIHSKIGVYSEYITQDNVHSLIGQIRTSSIHKKNRIMVEQCIPMGEDKDEDLYKSNIQIVELNALNAAFAVINYKKYYGFYQDLRDNAQTIYSINVHVGAKALFILCCVKKLKM
ncbi:MAG: hypothetical protein R3Y40_06160 [Eubacteriales bacterium]